MMRRILPLVLSAFLCGCATNSDTVYEIPTIAFEPGDGRRKVEIRYFGMPRQFASLLLAAASAQKSGYPEYWADAFKGDNTSLSVSCSNLGCAYRLAIHADCDGTRSVHFETTGTYPNLEFHYVSHGRELWEDCFPPRRPRSRR